MRYLNGPAGRHRRHGPGPRESSSGTIAWYLPDRLGTIRDLINNSGAIIDHVDYSAFGTVLDESSPSNGDRMMGFAGLDRDSASGLNLAVNRVENPGAGRWTSLDPMGFAAGDSNLDRYVGNQPTNFSDPEGTQYPVAGHGRGGPFGGQRRGQGTGNGGAVGAPARGGLGGVKVVGDQNGTIGAEIEMCPARSPLSPSGPVPPPITKRYKPGQNGRSSPYDPLAPFIGGGGGGGGPIRPLPGPHPAGPRQPDGGWPGGTVGTLRVPAEPPFGADTSGWYLWWFLGGDEVPCNMRRPGSPMGPGNGPRPGGMGPGMGLGGGMGWF